eukprot:TRINITY_DN113251_c0_g1_i1.p1 TRINITY_DN113251_c0_g1~~TRINITY_DN113251_c0_g1_i1.p1  ORF type:complete len:454 (+),score=48.52 TRINITY_DN113251_c0_g1_i1:71-1432(+)
MASSGSCWPGTASSPSSSSLLSFSSSVPLDVIHVIDNFTQRTALSHTCRLYWYELGGKWVLGPTTKTTQQTEEAITCWSRFCSCPWNTKLAYLHLELSSIAKYSDNYQLVPVLTILSDTCGSSLQYLTLTEGTEIETVTPTRQQQQKKKDHPLPFKCLLKVVISVSEFPTAALALLLAPGVVNADAEQNRQNDHYDHDEDDDESGDEGSGPSPSSLVLSPLQPTATGTAVVGDSPLCTSSSGVVVGTTVRLPLEEFSVESDSLGAFDTHFVHALMGSHLTALRIAGYLETHHLPLFYASPTRNIGVGLCLHSSLRDLRLEFWAGAPYKAPEWGLIGNWVSQLNNVQHLHLLVFAETDAFGMNVFCNQVPAKLHKLSTFALRVTGDIQAAQHELQTLPLVCPSLVELRLALGGVHKEDFPHDLQLALETNGLPLQQKMVYDNKEFCSFVTTFKR